MEHTLRVVLSFILNPSTPSPLLHIRLFHLNPNPTLSVKCDVRPDPDLLNRLPAIRRRPCDRWLSFRVRIHVKRNRLERLRNPRYDGRSFVISELLAETDTRSGVEGKENKWVGNKVFLDSLIEEAVRVEFESCG